MPQAPAAAGLQPASWEDVVRAVARQEGVNPALAIAVAKKESSLNPKAIGDGGKALGLFQLHDAAAQDMGVDKTDPLANIKGGVKYLKHLSGRYNGDLTKTLQAYNGGMKWVDEGTVTPAAQAYASEVLASLSAGVRQSTGGTAGVPGASPTAVVPVAGRGTGATNIGDQSTTALTALTRAYNPMHPEGRTNLAATAGDMAMTAAMQHPALRTGGITLKLLRALGPAAAAGLAAGAEVEAEQAAGTGYTDDPTGNAALKEGAVQGALSAGGRLIAWPIVRVGKTLMAPGVATRAYQALKDAREAAVTGGRGLVDTVKQQVDAVARTLKLSTQTAVDAVAGEAKAGVRTAKRIAAERLAATEASSAAELKALTDQYDNLLSAAPSTLAAGQGVRDALNGPVKRAVDLAGQRVHTAAQAIGDVDITPLKAAIDEMAATNRPASIFGGGGADAIGFTAGGKVPAVAARPAAVATGDTLTGEQFRKLWAQQLGVEETHPLPGILGKIQAAPDVIPGGDAHALKMLLDEAVNWDRAAKKSLERMTKGARIQLRELLSGNAEYNAATEAYQALIQLHRKGVGLQLQRLARTPDGADRIARMLSERNPAAALTLKSLLIDQAAAGGDLAAGQAAWDGIRRTYVFDHLITGGADKLGARLSSLATDHPEFVKIVFGDSSGATVVGNLGKLADAIEMAKAAAGEAATATKAIGAAGVTEARDVAEATVQASQRARQTALANQQASGAAQVQGARRQAQAGVDAVKAKQERLRESSMQKFVNRDVATEFTDAVRLSSLGLTSYWGILSGLRLLRSPSSADLLEWAAMSPGRTEKVVRLLTGQLPPQAVTALTRELYGVLGFPLSPAASHASEATATSAPTLAPAPAAAQP